MTTPNTSPLHLAPWRHTLSPSTTSSAEQASVFTDAHLGAGLSSRLAFDLQNCNQQAQTGGSKSYDATSTAAHRNG